jgi:hypothetical protein
MQKFAAVISSIAALALTAVPLRRRTRRRMLAELKVLPFGVWHK